MRGKYTPPAWAAEARKAMIDKNINMSELAAAIGYSLQHGSAVMVGMRTNRGAPCAAAIKKYLGVEDAI